MPGQSITKLKEAGEISIYTDQEATYQEIAESLSRIRVAFPKMQDIFFDLLAERIKENRFSGKRLRDATNYVIDNFQYKELNVADIVKFDKTAKVYTYNEVCSMITKGLASMEDFEIVEINGVPYRIMKKYNV